MFSGIFLRINKVFLNNDMLAGKKTFLINTHVDMFIKATRVAFLKNPIYSKEKSSVFWSFGPKQTVEVRPNCTCGQSLDYIHVLYT